MKSLSLTILLFPHFALPEKNISYEYICSGKISARPIFNDNGSQCEKTIIRIGSRTITLPKDPKDKNNVYEVQEVNKDFITVRFFRVNSSFIMRHLIEVNGDNTIFTVNPQSIIFSPNKTKFLINEASEMQGTTSLDVFSVEKGLLSYDLSIQFSPIIDCKNVKYCYEAKTALDGFKWINNDLISGVSYALKWWEMPGSVPQDPKPLIIDVKNDYKIKSSVEIIKKN